MTDGPLLHPSAIYTLTSIRPMLKNKINVIAKSVSKFIRVHVHCCQRHNAAKTVYAPHTDLCLYTVLHTEQQNASKKISTYIPIVHQ